ncbi:MAG: hypothetical protein MJA30_23265, partial [Cytophagales bacterium]|nr:hypothetical protein [Cytophagales bacterium]
ARRIPNTQIELSKQEAEKENNMKECISTVVAGGRSTSRKHTSKHHRKWPYSATANTSFREAADGGQMDAYPQAARSQKGSLGERKPTYCCSQGGTSAKRHVEQRRTARFSRPLHPT